MSFKSSLDKYMRDFEIARLILKDFKTKAAVCEFIPELSEVKYPVDGVLQIEGMIKSHGRPHLEGQDEYILCIESNTNLPPLRIMFNITCVASVEKQTYLIGTVGKELLGDV